MPSDARDCQLATNSPASAPRDLLVEPHAVRNAGQTLHHDLKQAVSLDQGQEKLAAVIQAAQIQHRTNWLQALHHQVPMAVVASKLQVRVTLPSWPASLLHHGQLFCMGCRCCDRVMLLGTTALRPQFTRQAGSKLFAWLIAALHQDGLAGGVHLHASQAHHNQAQACNHLLPADLLHIFNALSLMETWCTKASGPRPDADAALPPTLMCRQAKF